MIYSAIGRFFSDGHVPAFKVQDRSLGQLWVLSVHEPSMGQFVASAVLLRADAMRSFTFLLVASFAATVFIYFSIAILLFVNECCPATNRSGVGHRLRGLEQLRFSCTTKLRSEIATSADRINLVFLLA